MKKLKLPTDHETATALQDLGALAAAVSNGMSRIRKAKQLPEETLRTRYWAEYSALIRETTDALNAFKALLLCAHVQPPQRYDETRMGAGLDAYTASPLWPDARARITAAVLAGDERALWQAVDYFLRRALEHVAPGEEPEPAVAFWWRGLFGGEQ